MTPDRGRRVIASHSIARRAFLAAGLFGVAAVVWAGVVLIRGGSWWGPLHAFLAGTVLLAISGASQMFTITWAASAPPPAWLTTTQRWLMGTGAVGVLVGVTASIPALVWVGASAVVMGLVLLATSITVTVRRSLLHRFDLSARFYLTAFASGVAGVTLGAVMGSGTSGLAFDSQRLVHSHLNLVGLVGFTIVGTIPTFLPTIAHHRAVSGREALVGWWLCVAGAAAMAASLVGPAEWVGLGTILAGLAAILVLGGILARLWSKGRHRLPFLQVSAGMAWLIVWTFVDGISLISGRAPTPFGGWTAAVVVAGVAQVLAGSLAYLIPVLIGPPLGPNVDQMTRRRPVPLVAANLTGLALAIGWAPGAVAMGSVWLLDLATRLVNLSKSKPDPSV